MDYCKAKIGVGWRYRRCHNRAKQDGYCMIHHPAARAERKAKQYAKRNSEIEDIKKKRAEVAREAQEIRDKAARCEAAEMRIKELEEGYDRLLGRLDEARETLKACVRGMACEIHDDGTPGWIGRGPGGYFRDALSAARSFLAKLEE